MTVLETAKKMIDYSHGNLHDINHFMKVYAYAKMIADEEQLDPDTQKLVEMTALVHDIACPLCRVKYGNTNGKNQEKESAALIAEFLVNADESHFSGHNIKNMYDKIFKTETGKFLLRSMYQNCLENETL